MARYIDADKLKEYLQEYLHYGHAIPWVDAQPTAFDLDKVVQELDVEVKKSNERAINEASVNGHSLDYECFYGQRMAYIHARQIVKAGGIDERD